MLLLSRESFIPTHNLPTTGLSQLMDSDKATSNRFKRRVPQTLRRRALVSCDRCKKRRVRCLRSPEGGPEDPCQNCLASGVKCESTLPRKQRIYGSVESLSLRYRALDSLVKGLFPGENTEEIDTLFRIAEAHHITMPTTDDNSAPEHVPYESSQSVYPSPPADESAHDHSVTLNTLPSRDNPFISRPTKVAEERLIPASHGVSHYIGPSSSFGFAFTVRDMVAECHALSSQRQPDRAQLTLQSDFGGLRTSKALEPQDSEVNASLDEAAEQDFEGAGVEQQKSPSPFVSNPPKKNALAGFLPDREVADALVEAFFEQVHPSYLLFHRGTFQLRYESIWIPNQIREPAPGWICCIFMVFVFGAQALEHHDKQQSMFLQRRYLTLVQSRLHHLINTTSLVNIQALLLLQLLQHNASERNAAWMLLGCAS